MMKNFPFQSVLKYRSTNSFGSIIETVLYLLKVKSFIFPVIKNLAFPNMASSRNLLSLLSLISLITNFGLMIFPTCFMRFKVENAFS